MSESFGKWRGRLWPVHAHEYAKVLPLLLMKLLVALNYTLLFNTKDTLIVAGSSGSGAEVIPILKGWVVIPAAFLFMLGYAKMSNHLSSRQLFYASISPFLLFFALFTTLLYPYREWLTPNSSADALLDWLGPSRGHWVAIYRHWINTLFYVFADLWGIVAINLLFWTFANQICTVSEAKRFYTLFSAAGDLGAVFSAPIISHSEILSGGRGFESTLSYILIYTLGVGLLVVALYTWTSYSVGLSGPATPPRPRTKLSLSESCRMIVRSPYLRHLSMIVIGYGLTLNLIEVFWKANLKITFPQPEEYLNFMKHCSLWTGLISVLLTLLAAGLIVRRFGWHASAQITPVWVCVSGLLFFICYYQQEQLSPFFTLIGTTPALFLAYFGAVQNILSRTCKYAFLDPTKEMAYIPLDEESKIKGKAAVDVVASRLGKSGSSWLQAGLIELVGNGSVLSIVSYIGPIILATGAIWSRAVYCLNRQFQQLENSKPLDSHSEHSSL